MPKTQRDPAREQFWRQTMTDWRASGRTIRDFCRDRQLTEPAFHYWQRELLKRDAAARPDPSTPPAFVLVTLIPTPSVAAIEVRCPSGHVVMIFRGHDGVRIFRPWVAFDQFVKVSAFLSTVARYDFWIRPPNYLHRIGQPHRISSFPRFALHTNSSHWQMRI